MSTSRRVRRRNQSANRRQKRHGEQQAAQRQARRTQQAVMVARAGEALTAANALLAADFPDLHEAGWRLDWADDEDGDD